LISLSSLPLPATVPPLLLNTVPAMLSLSLSA
jgi:hypothetical protein